jgi:hypothetical protein
MRFINMFTLRPIPLMWPNQGGWDGLDRYRNVNKMLLGKPKGNKPLGKPMRRLKYIMVETNCVGMSQVTYLTLFLPVLPLTNVFSKHSLWFSIVA